MVSDRLKLVPGHTGYVFMPYVHLCPGCPCAIAAWLADVYNRRRYEELKPEPENKSTELLTSV